MDNLRRMFLSKEDVQKLDNVQQLTGDTTDYIKGFWMPCPNLTSNQNIIRFDIKDKNSLDTATVTIPAGGSRPTQSVNKITLFTTSDGFAFGTQAGQSSYGFFPCNVILGFGAGNGNLRSTTQLAIGSNYYIYFPFDLAYNVVLKRDSTYTGETSLLSTYPIYYEPAD